MCPNLPDCCQEAARTWKITKLIEDLEAKHRLLNGERGLAEWQKQYLCLLLAGKNPEQIADIIYKPANSTRVALSKKGGLYHCIERLTGQRPSDWRDPIIQFLNRGYRRQEEAPDETTFIMWIDAEVSEAVLRKLEENAKKIVGANQVRIQRIEKGSIVVFWQGSRAACDRLQALYEEGVLSERLGFPVLDVQQGPIKVRLSEWFRGIFAAGWQQAEDLLTPQQLTATVFSDRLERAKLINWRADLLSHAVVLLVNLTRESEDTVTVKLKLYPTGDEGYLPENLQLQVLVDADGEAEVFEEVTARSADEWIQCTFDAEPEDEFTVRLVLGEAIATEKFAV